MLLRVRMAAVARGAAVLVAVTLSGGPRVFALHAPVEAHRCCCKAHSGGDHECDCALCRRATLAAQAKDEKAPPCHRAAARKALSRNEPVGRRGAPCVEGHCGASDRPMANPAGLEPFFLPAAGFVSAPVRAEYRLDAAHAASRRPVEPETPPPRAS
jgi:hypothetical protein